MALTKVSGQVVKTNTDLTVGVLTATTASFTTVSVAGTITYDDVTNVDSVGLITARSGVNITSGGLIVTGISTVSAGTTSAPSISPSGDTNTGIFFPSADTIAFGEGGAEAARIDSSGRFGIGTVSPNSQLNVSATDNATIELTATGGGPYRHYLRTQGNDLQVRASSGVIQFFNGNNDGLSSTERARIDSSGRLLVGTSTSVANLYRATTASIAPTIQLENVTNSYNTGFSSLNYSASGFAPVVTLGLSKSNTQGTNTVVASGDELGYLQFVGADGTNFRTAAWIRGEVDGTPGSADMPGRLVFSTTADGSSTPTERARITSAGLFGIGTNSPSARLQVNQNTDTGTAISVVSASANTALTADFPGLFLQNTNTTNNNYNIIGFVNDQGDYSATIHGIYTSHTAGAQSGAIAFGTRNAGTYSEKLRITAAGNVGIGTTAPSSLLTLNAASNPALEIDVSNTKYADLIADTGSNATFLESFNGYPLAFSVASGGGRTERARIDTSGRLLVGTSSVFADSAELFESYKSAGSNRSWTSSSSLSNDDEASWGTIGGVSGISLRQIKVGVYKHSGITTPCAFMLMQAQNADSYYYWTDNTSMFRISTLTSNIGTTGGTVVGTQTSDERIKNILGPVEYGLETIKQIDVVRYSLKVDPETEKLGFIAQQVAPLVPEAIYDTKEPIQGEPEGAPTKLGMEYVALIPVLVNAIKELSAEVDTLKAQLQAQ